MMSFEGELLRTTALAVIAAWAGGTGFNVTSRTRSRLERRHNRSEKGPFNSTVLVDF
jgi:hypothetical protein